VVKAGFAVGRHLWKSAQEAWWQLLPAEEKIRQLQKDIDDMETEVSLRLREISVLKEMIVSLKPVKQRRLRVTIVSLPIALILGISFALAEWYMNWEQTWILIPVVMIPLIPLLLFISIQNKVSSLVFQLGVCHDEVVLLRKTIEAYQAEILRLGGHVRTDKTESD
jgi:hypothetical protein